MFDAQRSTCRCIGRLESSSRRSAIRLLTTVVLLVTTTVSSAADVMGAGSTFAFPVVAKWAASYYAKTGDKIHYQSIGSGGGIAQVKAGAVTFGASDKPLPLTSSARRGWPSSRWSWVVLCPSSTSMP